MKDIVLFLITMAVIYAVLAVLVISLTVVALLAWDVNSKIILPEIVQETSNWTLADGNIGTYLEILTGIVALLFPISLTIISDAKGKYFSSQEVTSVVFNQKEYKGLYFVLAFLLVLTIASFQDPLPVWFKFLMLLAMIGTLAFLYFYFKKLEKIVREKEKIKIDRLLGNGRN